MSANKVSSNVIHPSDVTSAELDADEFPTIRSISPAFMYQFMPVPHGDPVPPEYVHVSVPRGDYKAFSFVTSWNMAWEAGKHRFGMFGEEEVPDHLVKLIRHKGTNLNLLPDDPADPYSTYSAIYHLLPLRLLERYRLPIFARGAWPPMPAQFHRAKQPADFKDRLSRALADHLWPRLCRQSRSALSRSESTVLLAHSLDFWLPYLDQVCEARMRSRGRVAPDDEEQAKSLESIQEQAMRDGMEFTPSRPLFGGQVWLGEADAEEATNQLIEVADRNGRLRDLIEAIQSSRVEEDFSPRWSFAREDFERKLYSKRAKVKVSFVQICDTIPVHGPDAEVEAGHNWQDLLASVDTKDRRVVVCLREGTTRVGDIAKELGYANHSPVSKALDRIRKRARKLLG